MIDDTIIEGFERLEGFEGLRAKKKIVSVLQLWAGSLRQTDNQTNMIMNKMTFKLLAILLAFVMVSCSSGEKMKNNSGDKAVASRQVKELPYFKRVVLNGAFEVC